MPVDTEPGSDLLSKIESKLGLQQSETETSEATSPSKERSTISLEGGLAFEGGVA